MNISIFVVALLTFYCSCCELVDTSSAPFSASMFDDLSQCDSRRIYQYNETININFLRPDYFRSVGQASRLLPLELAIIVLGLDLTKATAQEAIAASANIISDVSAAVLRIAGVTKEELATSQFTVSQSFQWDNGENKFIGYIVSQTLVITTAQYNQVGEIISKAVQNGMNRIELLSFDAKPATKKSIEEKLIPLAIADAIANAAFVLNQVGYVKDTIKSVQVQDAFTQDGINLGLIDWSVAKGDLEYQIESIKTIAELSFTIAVK